MRRRRAEHKQLYLDRVIFPELASRGFGCSVIVGNEMVNVAYLPIPDMLRVWRKEQNSERQCGSMGGDNCYIVDSDRDCGGGLGV